jgi:hypothetical protein
MLPSTPIERRPIASISAGTLSAPSCSPQSRAPSRFRSATSDVGAELRQAQRIGAAEPARGAGDDRGPALQGFVHVLPPQR